MDHVVGVDVAEFARFHAGCRTTKGERVVGFYAQDGIGLVYLDSDRRFPWPDLPNVHYWVNVVDDPHVGRAVKLTDELTMACVHVDAMSTKHDRFPHVCRLCGGRVYVGFTSVEHEVGRCGKT